MCWVHEWGKAYRDISHAIEHIRRAKLKMEFRARRFPKQQVRYLDAATWCDNLIKTLESVQKDLLILIDYYGIKRGGKTLQKLLSNQPKLQPAEEWAEKN
jgi:hypothetical protein